MIGLTNSNKIDLNELSLAIGKLKGKIENSGYVDLVSEDAFMTYKVPSRGSLEYKRRREPRMRELKRAFKRAVVIEENPKGIGKTNALFITLTVDSKYSKGEAWKIVKEFSVRDIVRALKYRGYLRANEAQLSGMPHIHMLVILYEPILYRWDPVKKRGYILKQDIYNWLDSVIGKKWSYGFYDIRPIVGKREAVGYITKYCDKASEIESVLDEIEEGKVLVCEVEGMLEDIKSGKVRLLSESEIKRIWTHYYAGEYNMRLYTTSERLDKVFKNNLPNGRVWSRCDVAYWKIKYNGIIRKFNKILSIRGSPDRLSFRGVVSLNKIEGFNSVGDLEAIWRYFEFELYGLPKTWGYKFDRIRGNRVILEVEFYWLDSVVKPDWACYFGKTELN